MNQTPLPPTDSALIDPASSSGGLCALGGFFYQFVGSLCRAIRTFERWDEDSKRKGWKVVFSMEDFDQDAVEQILSTEEGTASVSINERRLIQFKYSRDPGKYPVQPDELHEIAVALKTSQNQANDIAAATTKFIVISNRCCSPKSSEVITAAATWNKSNAGKSPHPILDQKISKKHKNGTTSLVRKWSKNDIEVLKQIEWKEETMREHIHVIERRASSLGVLFTEVQDRIPALIGHYFSDVSKHLLFVTQERLDSRLSGLEEAQCLTGAAARAAMHDDFQNFLTQISALENAAPRDFEQELRDAMKYRALIFLYGDGGNGKTTLLYRLVKDSVALLPNTMAGATFGIGCCASRWTQHTLSKTVGRWRGDKNNINTQEDSSRAIQRLEKAAGVADVKYPVVLHLGLDAVDELGETYSSSGVEELINEFWERDRALKPGEHPAAVLLVSCRLHPQDIICPNDPYFHLGSTSDQALFHVPEFSSEELAQAAELSSSPGEPAHFLAQQIKRRGVVAESGVVRSDSPSQKEMLSAQEVFEDADVNETLAWEPELLQSLHHPTLWRCFQELPPAEQQDVLSGDPIAQQKLWESVVGWFLRKAKVRHRRYQMDIINCGRDMLRIAAQSLEDQGGETGEYLGHWLEPARNAGLNSEVIKILYDEALSSGLIIAPAHGRWHWKHSFIQQALTGGES